jgi:CheY-like chemotaxis protein
MQLAMERFMTGGAGRGVLAVVSARIVVIDDEPEVLAVVCAVLEEEGYAVLRLAHPVLTTDLKNQEPQPRLFLLDMMLPTMSGIDLALRLRGEGYHDTPMIAMSASHVMLRAARDSALFASSLAKPFDLGSLLGAVELHATAS